MRRLVTVLRLLLLLLAGLLVLGACSSAGAPAAPSDDPVLQEGAEVFASKCASCHGQAGGGGTGPKLAGRMEEVYPNIADQIAVIANGRGSMPAWGSALEPDQIEAVARYEREVL